MAITELSPQDEARIPEHLEKWKSIGLNTDRIDRDSAKNAVMVLYDAFDEKHPNDVYYAKSPKEALIINGILQSKSKKNKLTQEYIDNQEYNTDGTDVKSLIKDHFRQDWVFGAWDSYWTCFYDFVKDIPGVDPLEVDLQKKFEAYVQFTHNCGLCILDDDYAIICDRPVHIKFDDEQRLHSEFDGSIQWSDGYAIYNWHGTSVPKKWITDKGSMKASEILHWENMEQRRCGCEIMGWNKILIELNAKTVDKDDDPEIGELLEVNLPDSGKEKFLRVQCGTKREFALPVPPDMKTALEAQAWIHDIPPSEFMVPEIRT